MSTQDSHLKCLLSPTRSGTFFAPFRSRSANPEGFDTKMRMWIGAIEEWALLNKKLTFCLNDIHQTFYSDAERIRPDKECIRLVFSELRRRARIVPLNTLKTSSLWSSSKPTPLIDNYIDPKSWISWGVKKLVYSPATWAISAISSGQDETYSDLTDLSITDSMKFVCQKSLSELSQRLLTELVRIARAEKQFCFEWKHLLELLAPIMNTIIDAADGKEVLEMFDILIDYLAVNKQVATLVDNDCKLIKIANTEDSQEDNVIVTKKDVAIARLLKAKEKLTADADIYHANAEKAKEEALECYKRKELAKAKSLLRSSKRYEKCAVQREDQLDNVECMLHQLDNTDSNMMILEAYRDGAEALKSANTRLDTNMSMMDDMHDITAETRYLNEEMNQRMRDISCASEFFNESTLLDLEDELNRISLAQNDNGLQPTTTTTFTDQHSSVEQSQTGIDSKFVDELEQRLNDLVVVRDEPFGQQKESETKQDNQRMPSTAT